MMNKKQLFFLNCMGLFTYILGAYIGDKLILSPSGASSIWPPAGIALALVLIYRNLALPAIFLGSVLTQIPNFFDNPSIDSFINSLPIGVFISLGVCLQAIFATYLISHFIGEHDPLIKDSTIIKFLFIGSIVGSGIAPIFLTIELFYNHNISYSNLLSIWITRWIGSALGILIITPLILIFLARPRELWKKRGNYVLYPSLMLLAFSVVIFNYSQQQTVIHMKETFNRQSNLLNDALFNQLNSYLTINLILKSFFEHSTFISKDEFKGFSLLILQQYHTLASIEWIPYIEAKKRTEFENLFNVCIHELDVSKKKHYFPIAYIEPMENNQQFLGFNLGSNPLALKSLLLASESGERVVTEQLILTKEKLITEGIRIYSAVFSSDVDNNPILKGFVANTFSIEKEIATLMKQNNKLTLEVEILASNRIIYSSFTQNKPQKRQHFSLIKTSVLTVANHRWQISYMPSKEFIKNQKSWHPWWLLLGSFLFTGLTEITLLILTGRTLRTEELVKLRTLALSKAIATGELHNTILQALASPMPLNEILALVIKKIEDEDPEILCSVLLLDKTGKFLIHGASGRLPTFYTQAIDGLQIGKAVGSCGTAAYLKQRVIVADINQHPYWNNFIELTAKAELAACWSEPIMSSEQQVLGTFAIYYRQPKSPTKETLNKMLSLSKLIGLVIERKTSEERIRYLAFYDALTKLPNRRLLYERLNQELILVKRHHNYGALMFLDLDHFKTLNDSLGHHIGDELLIQVAKRLTTCLREEDTVARLGGDEFVILLRSRNHYDNNEQVLDYAIITAKRILKALYIPYFLEKYEHVVTSSIGITLFSINNNNVDNLFKQADIAMYDAKNNGRNTFSFYNKNMAKQANKRLQKEKDLRKRR